MDPSLDVLVRWKDDDTENVVALGDLDCPAGVRKGTEVKMWWEETKRWYTGVVIDFEGLPSDSSEDYMPLAKLQEKKDSTDESCQDSEDNIPIARLREKQVEQRSNDKNSEPFAETDSSGSEWMPANSDSSENDEFDGVIHTNCEHTGCREPTFAACVVCKVFLCAEHLTYDETCRFHRQGNHKRNPEEKKRKNSRVATPVKQPEEYTVEGEPRILTGTTPTKRRRSEKEQIREESKKNRNLGMRYTSEKTGKQMASRRVLKSPCNKDHRDGCGFQCNKIEEDRRQEIIHGYYDIGDLQHQREWLSRHISIDEVKRRRTGKVDSRRNKTIWYFLPSHSGTRIPVCRLMFMNTLGISERQIKTVVAKHRNDGSLEGEKRGGRQGVWVDHDAQRRLSVRNHIKRFPSMESHYCRSKSAQQYLSSDLNLDKMYQLYKEEHGTESASRSLYYKVLKEMKLKFHVPKKDQCSLCDTFHRGTDDQKETVQEIYSRHIGEKTAVREIKEKLKGEAKHNKHITVANFDLQQVIYLPKSNLAQIFYKRRLSCFNFTVYELESKAGHCYFWHEGLGGRGSNAIASHVHDFLIQKDNTGTEVVYLFADGCGGQNKNSILPAMFIYFLRYEAKHIKKITLFFF